MGNSELSSNWVEFSEVEWGVLERENVSYFEPYLEEFENYTSRKTSTIY